jgi:hypothetical protein
MAKTPTVSNPANPKTVNVWDDDMKYIGRGVTSRVEFKDCPIELKKKMGNLGGFILYTKIDMEDGSVRWGCDVYISPLGEGEPAAVRNTNPVPPEKRARSRSAPSGTRQPRIPAPKAGRSGRAKVSIEELRKRTK